MKRIVVRPQELAREIVIVDGFSGTGKSILMPVLSSLRRSEQFVCEYVFDYLCALRHLGAITESAAPGTRFEKVGQHE